MDENGHGLFDKAGPPDLTRNLLGHPGSDFHRIPLRLTSPAVLDPERSDTFFSKWAQQKGRDISRPFQSA